MRTRYGLVLAALVTLLFAPACTGSRPRSEAVTVKGSDTMVILAQRWAESDMAEHPGSIVQVTGGGSGTGVAALINGTTDICQASRPMDDDERAQMQSKYGSAPHETIVAKDGLAVYLHDSNPVRELTIAQIRGIYTGTITDWKEVGGGAGKIVLYGRENSSGTYEYFKDHVLEKADFAASVQTLPGTAAVVHAVARDANGIGYGGAAYAEGVRDCAVKRDDQAEAVLPASDKVLSGEYALSRDLYFYTREAPAGRIGGFVDFVLSEPGQRLVSEVGYYPIR